ncbi:MAG: PH domain-containing protein [Actinobacteria bacterium]|nr:PH domain-containing protein [Actinomycetota bacterium]MBI3686245.1 PH domain-containing protein [Actinomycetota bacterium]
MTTQWSVRRAETVLSAGAAAALLTLALMSDPAGRLLGSVGAAGLAVLAGGDLLWRPRLAVGPAGLLIRTPARRLDLGWAEIREVRLDEHPRFGMTTRTLEIDSGTELVIFGRRSLGADPRDVATAIEQAHRAHLAHGSQIPRQGTPPDDHPTS